MLQGIVAILLSLGQLLLAAAACAAPAEVGTRMSVLVLPCESAPRQAELAQLADDLLMKAMVEQRRFRVIEREKLQQVLREQQLVRERLTDPANVLRIGRLASADAILAMSLREEGGSLVAMARLFTTETSAELEFSATTSDASLPAFRELMRDMATRLAASLPLVEGVVLKSQPGKVVASIGSAARVRKGMGAVIYRQGKELKHPVTGRSLGFETVHLGEGTIVEVRPDSSVIRLSGKAQGREIATGDRVVTK